MPVKKSDHIILSLKLSFAFVVIFWIIEIFQLMGFDFFGFGILPRTETGLLGILTSPFIHGGVQHLIANSVPFFVLSFLLFLFYKKKAFSVFILIWLTTGLLTWLIGRMAWHIGASGVIYGLASFLVFGGIFSYRWKLLVPAILVIALYSGLILGIFPNDPQISWEGHLSGAISGLVWAIAYRKSLRNPEY